MSSQRLNAAEKDLEKFIKFLAMKATQVVVQSRMGEKMKTECNPLAGSDWFNIVVQDHAVVYDETKRAMALNPGESILQRLPLCIEISLRTVEGDQMVLEVWSLDVLQPTNGTQMRDEKGGGSVGTTNLSNTNNMSNNATDRQTLRAGHAIYSHMGLMLKSLISLTRATPAYKLSRRKCPDSYNIYYRIYVDRPQLHKLGEGHKNVKIGQLNTIVGLLVMSVAYRTKMTISPTTAYNADDNAIMLKSDHFRPSDASTPTHQMPTFKKIGGGASANTEKCIDIDKPLRTGAFTDIGKIRQYTEEDYKLPETPPFEWLLRRTRHESTGSGSIESLNNRKCESPINGELQPQPQQLNNNINNNNTNENNLNHNNNSTAFKSFEKPENKMTAQTNGTATEMTTSSSPIKSLLIPAPITKVYNSAVTIKASQPPDDDALLKELVCPFATNSHMTELANFYRECVLAPPLATYKELQAQAKAETTAASAAVVAAEKAANEAKVAVKPVRKADPKSIDDLTRELQHFETSLGDYDELVSQFGLTTSTSTGSRSSGGLQMSN